MLDPGAAQAGDQTQEPVGEQHAQDEHGAEGPSLAGLPGLGDIGHRDRNGGQRHGIDAEGQPGHEADAQSSRASMFQGGAKQGWVHRSALVPRKRFQGRTELLRRRQFGEEQIPVDGQRRQAQDAQFNGTVECLQHIAFAPLNLREALQGGRLELGAGSITLGAAGGVEQFDVHQCAPLDAVSSAPSSAARIGQASRG